MKFDTIHDAARWCYGDNRTISACCHGRRKSAFTHPVTKEKLIWKFI